MNPYWQILENSFNNFSEISTFRVMKQTDFLENANFFPNFQFFGHELDRVLENLSIFGESPGVIFQK